MRLYKGHLAREDLDILLTIDGEDITVATRPGEDQRWLTWSPPSILHPEDIWGVLPESRDL
jgi:hypothetical protein